MRSKRDNVIIRDAGGREIADDILLQPQKLMHPAVAVANVLKIWMAGDAGQCLRAMGDTIRMGKIKEAGLFEIDGRTLALEPRPRRDGTICRERCINPNATTRKTDEKYWILNPGAAGATRYAVKTDRPKLAELLDAIRKQCRNRDNAPIFGITITAIPR